MDKRISCVYGPPPIKDDRNKPVDGRSRVRKGWAKWLVVLILLAALSATIVFLLK